LISIIIYANTLSFGHALDDDIVIVKNIFTEKGIKGIPDLLSKDTFHGFFKKKKNLVSGGRYRPLSLVTFAIENEVFGEKNENGTFIYNPFFGHLINILIYALSCFIALKLLYLLFKGNVEGGDLVIVGCVLLFALHPLHTEVVANIKGRDELLAFLLSISALYIIFKHDDKLWAYFLSGFLIFLGLMSKENSITFLAVIPLCFYFFKTKKVKTLAIVTLPALAGSLFYLWIRYKIIGVSSPTGYCEILNDPFCGVGDSEKYATIVYTWLKYWGLLLFPIDLTHDYYPKQIPIKTWKDSLVVLSLLINITLVLLSIYGVVKKKVYGFALAFYWICFSIVSNLLFNVGTFMNERFLYFSSLGFCLLTAWGIWQLTGMARSEKINRNLIYGLVILILGGLYGFKTFNRNYAWKDNKTLFETDVKVSSNSIKCNTSYGGKLIEAADKIKDEQKKRAVTLKAVKHLKKAIKLYPGSKAITSWNLMGKGYTQIGDYNNSRICFENCLKINPNYPEARQNMEYLAYITYKDKDYPACIKVHKNLIQYIGAKSAFYNKIGQIYGQHLDEIDSSIYYLKIAEKNDSNNVTVMENLGVAISMTGNYKLALNYFEKALLFEPEKAQLHMNLYLTYHNLGKLKKAKYFFGLYQKFKKEK